MAATATYYLIDYENVHDNGLSLNSLLNENDEVHLFYTQSSMNANLDTLSKINHLLHFHKVPSGNESLDKHLVSYLGFLIGRYNSRKPHFVIISKDKGYDHIIKFFNEFENVNIIRKEKISAAIPQKQPKKSEPKAKAVAKAVTKAVAKPVAKQATKQKAKTTASKRNTLKTDLNATIQKTLSKANYPSDISNRTASIVSKNHSLDKGKQIVYRFIVREYGQKRGLDIYNRIKKYL